MANKKANTLWFMLIATVVNVLLLVIFFVIGFIIISWLPTGDVSSEEGGSPLINAAILIVFIGAIGGTFLVYGKLVKWADKKFNLEDKMGSIFAGGRKKPKKNKDEEF